MRVQDILIGLLLFSVVATGLFITAFQLYNDTAINMTVNDTFNTLDTRVYKDLQNTTQQIADKSPGGIESQQIIDTGASSGGELLGLNVMSLLFNIPKTGKKIIFGEHNATDVTKEGLVTVFGIPEIYGYALIAAFVIIISIILISSVLRNRW